MIPKTHRRVVLVRRPPGEPAESDFRIEEVQVPEWGGVVLIAAMSGKARDAWEQAIISAQRKQADGSNVIENARAMLVAFTAVDEQGSRIFTSEDIERLGMKSAAALERSCKVAQRLNLVTDKDLEDAKGN